MSIHFQGKTLLLKSISLEASNSKESRAFTVVNASLIVRSRAELNADVRAKREETRCGTK